MTPEERLVEAMARAAYAESWGRNTDVPLPPIVDDWYEGCTDPEQWRDEARAALVALSPADVLAWLVDQRVPCGNERCDEGWLDNRYQAKEVCPTCKGTTTVPLDVVGLLVDAGVLVTAERTAPGGMAYRTFIEPTAGEQRLYMDARALVVGEPE